LKPEADELLDNIHGIHQEVQSRCRGGGYCSQQIGRVGSHAQSSTGDCLKVSPMMGMAVIRFSRNFVIYVMQIGMSERVQLLLMLMIGRFYC
jgi:hypothetical protein